MTSRKEMIGKIAEAIDDAQESKRRNGFAATPGELAEAVMTVFEEAHTPTDDEREALIEQATWALIEWDTDTADRGVADEHYRDRRADVER